MEISLIIMILLTFICNVIVGVIIADIALGVYLKEKRGVGILFVLLFFYLIFSIIGFYIITL